MSKEISGTIENIRFRNEDNGYTVAIIDNGEEYITAVGKMPLLHDGQDVQLTGEWGEHDEYGEQFNVDNCKVELPTTEDGVEKYLASSVVEGIGPVIAERIVDEFGADSLRIVDEEPDKLLTVDGIGESRLNEIKDGWAQHSELRDFMLFLQSHDISTTYAEKIHNQYGEQGVGVLQENPYQLSQDIDGIGFKRADDIARKMEIGKEAKARIKAGIKHTLREASNDGHCFYWRSDLVEEAVDILSVPASDVEKTIDEMIKNKELNKEDDIVTEHEDDALYLPNFHNTEEYLAKEINNIAKKQTNYAGDGIEDIMTHVKQTGEFSYNTKQLRAIRQTLKGQSVILTGGPGTGKTTTVKGVLRGIDQTKADVMLMAPTGRAAKRLSETTSNDAETIHRALGYRPPNNFKYNKTNPFDVDVVIVDEMSMVDLFLMRHLVDALPEDATLLCVGDIDQLPSVGPGNILNDLIESGVFNVVRLNEVFRQAQQSEIIVNAHKINQGNYPNLYEDEKGEGRDFHYIERNEPESATETIVDIAANRLPKKYDINPATDIQVIAPMYQGACGVDMLNNKLQNALNPTREQEIEYGNNTYRVGDRIMQVSNDYEKSVFNGDVGIIETIDKDEENIVIDYPGVGQVNYNKGELSNIAMAYAVTIHKSQGSEYPIVILPLLTQHYIMLKRNLFYTALTRAEDTAVLVGSKKAIGIAVNTEKREDRLSMLADRLSKEARKGELDVNSDKKENDDIPFDPDNI